MDLILWRHAEARDARDGEADTDRPLTPRGEKQAAKAGAWLNRYLPETTRVLVSPARRTRQTAEALGRKLRIVDALAVGAAPHQVLDAARWPDSREPVLLVGHQPTLGLLAAYLMAGAAAADAPAWTVRKGAIWWLRQRVREDRSEVVLVTVRPPEML
jgi:phosphohistidine phosphatase